MTSKLKCPVCQNNLHKINEVVSVCTNDKCKLWGSSIPNLVLEALIQAKQDLKKARQALKDARIFASTHCIASAVKTIDKALEQIEHKEQI